MPSFKKNDGFSAVDLKFRVLVSFKKNDMDIYPDDLPESCSPLPRLIMGTATLEVRKVSLVLE